MLNQLSSSIRRWSTFTLAAVFILTTIFTLNSEAVHAATIWTVTTTNDDAAGGTCSTLCSLRDALNSASNGDTIQFQSGLTGTITVGSAGPLNITTSVTITGPGILNLAIDGAGTGSVFIISNGNTVSISGLKIQHGNGIFGGGIYNQGTLTVNNTAFSGNSSPTSAYGGGAGIYSNGTLTISNSTLSGNSAYEGGGIRNEGTLVVSNSTISGNSVTNVGGGILNEGTITLDNSSVSLNSAVLNGGGIRNDGTLTIRNSTVSGNLVAGPGGGVFNVGATLIVSNSTFSGNSSTGIGGLTSEGGAISNASGALVVINNSTFSANSANQGGGLFSAGVLTISNSTFSGNSATTFGGGIESDGGTVTVGNSTVSNNSAVEGGGIYNGAGTLNLLGNIIAKNNASYTANGGLDVLYNSGNVTSLGYNLIGNGTGSGITATLGDQFGTNGTPIDPLLGVLGDHGGSTQTMPITGSSLAYKQGFCGGNVSVTPNVPAVTTDQRGHARKSASAGCDVGAYEVPLPPQMDSIGIYRAGTFYLRLHNSTGYGDITVNFTTGTNPYPIVGDWTGAGFDTVGVYDQSNGQFTLCTVNISSGCINIANRKSFVLGNPLDQPMSGRWSIGSMQAGGGTFRRANGLIYLKDALTTGYADHTMVLGIPGDIGLAGDWNSKGFDSPGVYRPTGSTFYLSNVVTNGSIYGDISFSFGVGGDAPVIGDWIAQGHDGIGLFRQNNGFTYLKNTLVTGYADNSFTFGVAGDIPVAGHWQQVYPPIAPAPILIAKTVVPQPSNVSISGDNPIGD